MSLWWPGEWDRLVSKVEDWILKKNGYSKMQPQRLSRGYQSLVSRPRTEKQCVTFRFEPASSTVMKDDDARIIRHQINDTARRKSFTAAPQRRPSTMEEQLGRCVNSLDQMENTLRQYEKAFTKLPKRGPKSAGLILNKNLDVLNEEVIQKIFVKCYNLKRRDESISYE